MTPIKLVNRLSADPTKIAGRMRQLREGKGLSQLEVSRLMGHKGADKDATNSVYRLERGDRAQRLDMLAGYMTALDLPLTLLFIVGAREALEEQKTEAKSI
jgi:transcriptional regulator with XRE-family HTH domain